MSLGALMMIHDPSGFTFGTVKDHEKQIETLTALGDAMASIYAKKSGRTQAECRSDMEAEIWLTADEAVKLGYATARWDLRTTTSRLSQPPSIHPPDEHLIGRNMMEVRSIMRRCGFEGRGRDLSDHRAGGGFTTAESLILTPARSNPTPSRPSFF